MKRFIFALYFQTRKMQPLTPGRPVLLKKVVLATAAPAPPSSGRRRRAKVTGIMSKINREGTKAWVYLPDSDRTVELSAKVGELSHARVGDAIGVYTSYDKPDGPYMVVKPAFLKPKDSRDALAEIFLFVYKGRRFTIDDGFRLYDDLDQFLENTKELSHLGLRQVEDADLGLPEDTSSPVARYLSQMAEDYGRFGKEHAYDPLACILKSYIGHMAPARSKLGLPDEEAYARLLVLWWRDNYDLRRLKMLVPLLTQDQIEKEIPAMEKSLRTIYNMAYHNPYTVPALTMEQCSGVLDRLGKGEPDPIEVRCGEIVRALWRNQYGKSWSCTTKAWVVRRFPYFSKLKDKLEREYDLVYDVTPTYKEPDDESPTGRSKRIYFSYAHKAETYIHHFITQMVLSPTIGGGLGEPQIFNEDLDPDQIEAIRKALNYNVSLVTGPAGSGKTTMLTDLIKNLKKCAQVYMTSSFTGKAVFRIKQVTKDESAATLHRLIRDKDAPQFKVLVVDETSMLDMKLLYQFLTHFQQQIFRVVFVGDVNQLPPIGMGAFFNACLNCYSVPKTVLSSNHRVMLTSGELNGIIYNTGKVAKWRSDSPFPFQYTSNFIKQDCGIAAIRDILFDAKARGLKPADFIILSPYKSCLDLLNKLAQRIFNGNKPRLEVPNGHKPTDKCPTQKWYHTDCDLNTFYHQDDKIMMRKNNYRHDIMNGEEGTVVEIGPYYFTARFGSKLVRVRKPGRSMAWKMDQDDPDRYEEESSAISTNDISLAYIITVHAAQGSEWDEVWAYAKPDATTSGGFLNRNLIYTMLSRGKKKVTLIGSTAVFSKAVGVSLPYRCEGLEDRLRASLPRIYKVPVDDDSGGSALRPPGADDYPSEDDCWGDGDDW